MRFSHCTLLSLSLASEATFANWDSLLYSANHTSYDLRITLFWVCVAVAIIVFGIMFYAIIHYRKSKQAHAQKFHKSIWTELAWSIIPLIILILMAIPASKVLLQMQHTHDVKQTSLQKEEN